MYTLFTHQYKGAACILFWATLYIGFFFVIKPSRCTIPQIYFVMKIYMFRKVRLSIIRSLFTVHSATVYVIQVCRQLSSKSVWINSWWWTDKLSETCRFSWQNKFGASRWFYYKEKTNIQSDPKKCIHSLLINIRVQCVYIFLGHSVYITRLAANEVFSPSNKIHREAGWAKDLSSPL
jgi:hypothetical protein